MTPSIPLYPDPCVKSVRSFQELRTTPFADGMNALCWPRILTGNFAEVVQLLGSGDGIVTLDDADLSNLTLSKDGTLAVSVMLADLRLLREQDLEPELNCIHAYLRDEASNPIATDVFSFHADSATAEADTWLCTYHGAPSEGLPNGQACLRADIPATRAALLRHFGGADDASFRDYLADHAFDLHYAPLPDARPYSFGVGNLWRIATDWPGSPVPPCIHRAPQAKLGDPARLLLIC